MEAGSGQLKSKSAGSPAGQQYEWRTLPPGSTLAPATSCSQLSDTFIFASSFLENLTEYLRHEAV